MGEPLPAALSLAFSCFSNVFLILIMLSCAYMQTVKITPWSDADDTGGGESYGDVETDLHTTARKVRNYCLGTIRKV